MFNLDKDAPSNYGFNIKIIDESATPIIYPTSDAISATLTGIENNKEVYKFKRTSLDDNPIILTKQYMYYNHGGEIQHLDNIHLDLNTSSITYNNNTVSSTDAINISSANAFI